MFPYFKLLKIQHKSLSDNKWSVNRSCEGVAFVLNYLKKGDFLGVWYISRAKHWSRMTFILRAMSLLSSAVWQGGLLCYKQY